MANKQVLSELHHKPDFVSRTLFVTSAFLSVRENHMILVGVAALNPARAIFDVRLN